MSESGYEQPPTAAALRAAFDGAPAYTVGIEDEVMLLDPETLALTSRAQELLAWLDGDARFKLELPASQLEIVTPPVQTVGEAMAALFAARRELAARVGESVRLAAAGVHPFSAGLGELHDFGRYARTIEEYGLVAARQLVCAFQVHVSVGGADRALHVYNAARSYLPWIAALAANAPFYEGRDTGLASVRPKLGSLLPRQGIPPVIPSWEEYAEILVWGAATGTFPSAHAWWWELRLHPRYGTLEFRVPDGQSTVGNAAVIAALIQALVAWLGARHDAGETLPVAPSWRIEENRWSACRYGVEGTMAGLKAPTWRATRACLEELLETLEPVASRLGAQAELERADQLLKVNGAIAQRAVGTDGGPVGVTAWLADRFLEPLRG